MLVVIYNFQVKPNAEAAFKEAWSAFTELLYKHAGSLGSSLHRDAEGQFIAYAQWPDKESRDTADSKLPASAFGFQDAMRSCCTSISVEHELEMLVDLRRTHTFDTSSN